MNFDSDALYNMTALMLNAMQSLISLAISAASIVGMWLTFKKANEPGWAAIIPFYNSYILYKIAGKKKLFWWYLGIFIVYFIALMVFVAALVVAVVSMGGINVRGAFSGSMFAGSIGIVILTVFLIIGAWVTLMVFNVLVSLGLVKSFGQSGAMALGFIFLPIVFWLIFGLSKNIQYVGNSENRVNNNTWNGGGYGNGNGGNAYIEGNYSDNNSHLS